MLFNFLFCNFSHASRGRAFMASDFRVKYCSLLFIHSSGSLYVGCCKLSILLYAMDDSSSDSDGLPSESTLASALGIKGPLRFRPHGSSQKAHVILRRVELSGDSSDDEENKSTVYFSLFAQKKIDVKPGKEILLAVTEGKYKDQAVIFEGDLPAAEMDVDMDENSQMETLKGSSTPPKRDILPPKMRRTWGRKVPEQVSPMNSE